MFGFGSHKPTVINWQDLGHGVSQSRDGRFRITVDNSSAEKMYQLTEIGLTHNTNLGKYHTFQQASDTAKDYA